MTGQRQDASNCGIHWLAGTTDTPLDDVLAFLSETFHGADFSVRDSGVSGYTRTFTTLYGLRILDNEDRPEMAVHVIADGSAAESIGYESLQLIYYGLQLRPTRIDVAIDSCPFEPLDLYAEWLKDNVRTRCKAPPRARLDRRGIRAHTWMSSPAGDTFYMGSRQSTAFARCYDERGFTRFELELKAERAVAASAVLFGSSERFAPTAMALAREFVDFVDKTSSANRSRCQLIPFWQEFVGQVSRLKLALPQRPEATIQRTEDWIWGQVAPSLALYELWSESADGKKRSEIRRALRREGLKRLRPRHQALLKAAEASLGSPGS